MQLNLLDYSPAIASRNLALETVQENSGDWFGLAYAQLEQIARHPGTWANLEHGVTGEDLRHMIEPHAGKPHHPNAFGALINRAVRNGLLVKSGRWTQMKDRSSHARQTPVYVLRGDA